MKKKVSIVGATGFTGGELIRILLQHPEVELVGLVSRSTIGKKVYDIHTDLLGETELSFSEQAHPESDIVFLCLPHGETQRYLGQYPIQAKLIIDLSNDFRLKENANGFIYGLPELNRDNIKTATKVANPGCFATAIQLALLPLANAQRLTENVHISGITGSTGAGNKLETTLHYTWRNNNVSNYKALSHQHLAEIGQSLLQLQHSFDKNLHFIPYRGSFTRGIMTTLHTTFEGSLEFVKNLYAQFYAKHPFVFISDKNIDVKQVVNTNKCFIHLDKQGNQLVITSCIDNLVKGASGQAVQNMNLAMGWEETTGLKLKASAY
ncbi:MAG: N-acetyl-gamma-glutamyl-phosphate reductase [Chitinophagales bacterium]|nr:N-acetyl-gamma-glutamyl-phosphate reductase [Chitinophagales bacterium]